MSRIDASPTNTSGTSSSGINSPENGFVYVNLPPPVHPDHQWDGSDVTMMKGRRSKFNLIRMWRSLSRFQRSTAWALCVIAVLALVYSYSSSSSNTLTRKPVTPKNSEDHSLLPGRRKNETMDDYYRKKAVFPTPQLDRPPKAQQKPDDGRWAKKQPALVPTFSGPTNDRQRAVVAMFKHAWKGYKDYAWGSDHLKPNTKSSHNWFGLGLTIIDSLDTLLIMNLTDDFKQAREWVDKSLSFDVDKNVNLFETTIRCLAGLLSAYHLTNDEMFLLKARDLGERLSGAFITASGIPYSDVNLRSKKGKPPSWSPDSSLSEVATLQLEFRDLSRATGLPSFETLSSTVSSKLHKLTAGCADGLCPMFVNPKTGQLRKGSTITLGARTDSYYEYLLKQWLQTNKTIDWLRDDYLKAMTGVSGKLVRSSEPNKLTFVGEMTHSGRFQPKMDHLVCFLGGTLALGVVYGHMPKEHLDIAKQLTHTCHMMSQSTKTGLAPEIAYFGMLPGTGKEDIQIKPLDAHCLLRPEAIESFFYLYRLTGEKIYQDFGWQVFEAIEKYAKIDSGGYSSIQNVKKTPVQHKDMMESFFLAETLKYLYLLFDDSRSVIPLDKWVFNTEAHPLPILPN